MTLSTYPTKCSTCSKKSMCNKICEPVKGEITGRGLTASLKPHTYTVDFDFIQNCHQNLNPFQVAILDQIAGISIENENRFLDRLTVKEAIEQAGLTEREKMAVHLRYIEGLEVGKVGEAIGVSQPRASVLLKRALATLRIFLKRDM